MTPAADARRPCRLCEAGLDTAEAVELRVPRGVHYFLSADDVASDRPVTLRIVSCPYCGHLQSLDDPIIYDEQASSATYVSAPLIAARARQAQRTFGYADQPPRRALEIGCGDGTFLAEVAGRVEAVLGIEPSAANAAAARGRGIPVESCLLAEASRLPGGPFDAFFAFHVLEHVPDVKAFLRGIRANVVDGAVGCIEVPSSEAAYEHARFGHFMTDHLSYFFADTLRLAVESSGFEVVALEREWGGEHLVAYVRARTARPHRAVPGWIAATTSPLAQFVATTAAAGGRIAFWGASNPILPVLMQLPPNLPFILVDKAGTKHGRCAPGSHVPIFPLEELRARRIDHVVVTAPRFFDEIAAELASTFDAAVEVVSAHVGVADRICRLAWRS